MEQTIGILAGHGERLAFREGPHFRRNPRRDDGFARPRFKSEQFDSLFSILRQRGLRPVSIDSGDLARNDEHLSCTALLIGDPREHFSIRELDLLRSYMNDGGSVLVLQDLNDYFPVTNIGELYPDIVALDDMLVNPDPAFQLLGGNQPVVDISSSSTPLGFNGRICYKNGCTFDVQKDVTLILSPSPSLGYFLTNCYCACRGCVELSDQYLEYKPIPPGAILVHDRVGKGSITVWGSLWSFSEDIIGAYDNAAFLIKLIDLVVSDRINIELKARMREPQRHRLLHAYPMRSGMKDLSVTPEMILQGHVLDPGKKLAIGVIPHPFCNPTVYGCGFCTFPRERYRPESATKCVSSVIEEMKQMTRLHPQIGKQRVSSIYLGGGTSNLTSPDDLNRLGATISDCFRISDDTEVTFEGAPRYFADGGHLLDAFKQSFNSSRLRISIGIQTFDEPLLQSMGRQELNKRESVEEAIRIARARNILISADFLFNLPGQTWEQIEGDVLLAVEHYGIEHICFYNLVCFKGLGTIWSEDSAVRKSIPNRRTALSNWRRLRDLLDGLGYEPITVTDFGAKAHLNKSRYQYEEDLRHPERYDWLGFGPNALTLLANKDFTQAIKLMNPSSSSEYILRQGERQIAWQLGFPYDTIDLKIYWLTRQLKGCRINKSNYQTLFGSSVDIDFKKELDALAKEELITEHDGYFELSPDGMFYLDSITGLIASARVSELMMRGTYSHRKFTRGIDSSIDVNAALWEPMG